MDVRLDSYDCIMLAIFISGFSIYEIIKYHRLTRKLKKITEKRTCFLPGIGDVEYRISPLV